jgi:hypothetical protein
VLLAVRKAFRAPVVKRSDEAVPAGAAAVLAGKGFSLVHSSFRQFVKEADFVGPRLRGVDQLRIGRINIACAGEIAARRVYRSASHFDCTPITFDTRAHPKRSGR